MIIIPIPEMFGYGIIDRKEEWLWITKTGFLKKEKPF